MTTRWRDQEILLEHALTAWKRWFEQRLERIREGANEDYTGYEMDLLNAVNAFMRRACELARDLRVSRAENAELRLQVAQLAQERDRLTAELALKGAGEP